MYPTSTGVRGHGRNGRGQGRDAPAQGRHFREYSTLPASHGYKQGPQGFYSRQQVRRGPGLLYPNDDFGYLSGKINCFIAVIFYKVVPFKVKF